jgi:hypothetical protein
MCQMKNDIAFDFFSNRLHLVKVTNDNLINIELWHCLSVFENNVFGVVLQYNRIRASLENLQPDNLLCVPVQQTSLDIYYYVLTWDKLKKVYEKIKAIVNRIQQTGSSLPKEFILEFRVLKKRIDHLFSAFNPYVRNEYEHPSLKPYSIGNIIMFGNITIDTSGDITAHVGKDCFATIRHEHSATIQDLRTDLIDLFLKHFSEKPLTQNLIKARTQIEENVESILKELEARKDKGDEAEFNSAINSLLMYDIYLAREGVPLSATVNSKLYSMFAGISSISA